MDGENHAKEQQYEIALPNPSALIESLRAFGYDLKTALSDLIDNSIAARSVNIWIDASWAGSQSTLCITDDGEGMTQAELLEAMRPGSRNPREIRVPEDLGRFGLGLKTASFSQCRRLTVRSKKRESQSAQYCWDLDYVSECGEWRVLKESRRESEKHLSRLNDLSAGTAVLWEDMDRLVASDDTEDAQSHDVFLDRLEKVKCHIAMVFHRFLKGRDSVRIYINDRQIEPWDPFLESHLATQRQPEEVLIVDGQQIHITPFVLPHNSKLTADEHSSAAGPRGWNSHQGFYVYRNRRLLVSGDWLGLGFQKEEHYKLARIQVDIPNSLDDKWAIDVRKAMAHPPKSTIQDMKRIARLARQAAANIYRHRGKIIARQNSCADLFIWLHKRKHGKQFYRINRRHPLVIEALRTQPNDYTATRALFRLLEETVPVPLIVINQAEHPDTQSLPFDGAPPGDVLEVMEEILDALLRSGQSAEQAFERIAGMEPFDRFPEVLAILREKRENK